MYLALFVYHPDVYPCINKRDDDDDDGLLLRGEREGVCNQTTLLSD